MQDDFGDFLQATSTSGPQSSHARMSAPFHGKMMKELDVKIMQSFDLDGSSQRASLRFKQPAPNMGRRPQSNQYKPSANAADWSNLDVKTSDFTLPVKPQAIRRPTPPRQPNQQHNYQVQGMMMDFGQPYNLPQGNMNQFHPSNYNTKMFSPPQMNLPNQFSQSVVMPGTQSVQQMNGAPNVQRMPFNNHQMLSNTQQRAHSIVNDKAALANAKHSNSPANFQTISHGKSPALPSWMTRPNEIPVLFKKVLKFCATPNSFADTSRLYPILVSSQLPKDILGHIWSAANQSTPGKLTFTEMYIALAMIGLAQTGDMNLNVSHVTSLRVPPIPQLQFNFNATASTQPLIPSSHHMAEITMKNRVPQQPIQPSVPVDDDFSDFQSVPAPNQRPPHVPLQSSVSSFSSDSPIINFPSLPNHGQGIDTIKDYGVTPTSLPQVPPTVIQDNDFGNFFHAPAMKGSTKVETESFPDRNMINSPSSKSLQELENVALSATSYASGFDNTNVSGMSSESTMSNSSSAQFPPSMLVKMPGYDSISKPDRKPNGAFTINEEFGEFSAAPTNNTVLKFGQIYHEPVKKPTVSSSAMDNILNVNEASDKYSALRDLFPPTERNSKNEDIQLAEADFSDFQSSTSKLESDLFSTDDLISIPSVAPIVPINTGNSSTAFNGLTLSDRNVQSPSIEKLSVGKEDSSSVRSLELPSLSKTLSNLSIGSSSPFKSSEVLGDLYSMSNMIVSEDKPKEVDSQLYSLDEPISPPSIPKHYAPSKTTAEQDVSFGTFSSANVPMNMTITNQNNLHHSSPQKERKRFTMPRKISETESDFGDFSAAPPPLDDEADNFNAEFDMYQGGNSSLVDFDAFGHFEEAKVKKSETPQTQSKTKEESTAFSELMKSSGGHISSAPSQLRVNGTSDCKNRHVLDGTEEEWGSSDVVPNENRPEELEQRQVDSEFKYVPPVVDANKFVAFETMEIMHSESGVIGSSVPDIPAFDDRDVHDCETYQESQKPTESAAKSTEWELEAEELKSRMDGNVSLNSMDLYIEHWGRCLATCKDIIVSTGDIFATLNSPTVCHEIVNSARGREFITCTSEVYGVARRIRSGIKSVGLQDNDLEQTLKDIEFAWNNLLGFCPYTPSVHKTPEHCCRQPLTGLNNSDPVKKSSACSLCLLSTEVASPVGLEYGGCSYHAPCANLWLNQVAPILPRLELPTR